MWLSLEEIRQVYSVHLGSCIPHLSLLLKSNGKKAKQQLYVNWKVIQFKDVLFKSYSKMFSTYFAAKNIWDVF